MIETEQLVSLFEPDLGAAEHSAVLDVLRSGWLSMGAVTRSFEDDYAAALGVPDAIAVSSGTAALHLAMLAIGLGPGDEVIMPSLSFVASAAVVAMTGATPVFAEVVGPDDLTVDPADVAARITPRTRAIVAMHYGGYGADMTALAALAAGHGLVLIEDAAHAPVVTTRHGVLGTIGDIGCFSFFATKNLAVGEGGMVVARSAELQDKVRRLRAHSFTVSSWDRHVGGSTGYDVDGFGLNYRPTEIGSAMGRVQLGRLAAAHERRREHVARYREALGEIGAVHVPFADRPVEESAHHLFAILLPPGTDRAAVQAHMLKAGVRTGVHYAPTHLFTVYRERFGTGEGDLPVTEEIAGRLLSLPMWPGLTGAETSRVLDAVGNAMLALARG